MKEVTTDDVLETFKCAKNLNAALKNLLKREGSQNEGLVKFAKNFRAAATGVSPMAAMKSYIERNFKNEEIFFVAAARYAHAEFLEKLIDSIIAQYGDEFNGTYVLGQNTIEIKDKKRFEEIAKDVAVKTDAALKDASLPQTSFMQLIFFNSLFEPLVLREVLKLL